MNALRHLVLVPALLFGLGSCATPTANQTQFAKPNTLMGDEIRSRIDNINYQHRDELVSNLLWLTQTGEQAIPALLEGLNHTAPKVRSNCAWVLAQIGDRRVIPYLQKLVADSHETVRLEAARSLVLLGDMKHSPMLIEGLDSEHVQVRYLCHEALKSSTGRDFGFDHLSEDATQRHRSVWSWRQWWSNQAGDPWFAKQYATQHGLSEDGQAPANGVGNQPPPAPMGETRSEESRSQTPAAERSQPQWQALPEAPAGEARSTGRSTGDSPADREPQGSGRPGTEASRTPIQPATEPGESPIRPSDERDGAGDGSEESRGESHGERQDGEGDATPRPSRRPNGGN